MRKIVVVAVAAAGLTLASASGLSAQVFPPVMPGKPAPLPPPGIAVPPPPAAANPAAARTGDQAIGRLRVLLADRGLAGYYVEGPMYATPPGAVSPADLALADYEGTDPLLSVQPEAWLIDTLAFDADAWAEAQTCYRMSAKIDRSRTREWRGEVCGLPTEDDWPRFMRLVLLPASAKDPVVFRAVRRSMLLLDAPGALRRNDAVIARARAIAAAMAADAAPRAPGPTRAELLAAMRSSAQVVAA
jgi:hypothetical protein